MVGRTRHFCRGPWSDRTGEDPPRAWDPRGIPGRRARVFGNPRITQFGSSPPSVARAVGGGARRGLSIFFKPLVRDPTVCPAGPRGCRPRLISCMHHQQVFHKGPRVPGPSSTAEARLSPERDQAGGNRHRGRVPQSARAAGLSRVRRPGAQQSAACLSMHCLFGQDSGARHDPHFSVYSPVRAHAQPPGKGRTGRRRTKTRRGPAYGQPPASAKEPKESQSGPEPAPEGGVPAARLRNHR